MSAIGSCWAQPSWANNVWADGTWANAAVTAPSLPVPPLSPPAPPPPAPTAMPRFPPAPDTFVVPVLPGGAGRFDPRQQWGRGADREISGTIAIRKIAWSVTGRVTGAQVSISGHLNVAFTWDVRGAATVDDRPVLEDDAFILGLLLGDDE